MANYYFLASSLPPLELDTKPEMTFEELAGRLQLNLTKSDMAKAEVLRRYADLNNIRSLLLEEPIDPRGNLTEKELDEALLIHNILPLYIFDYLDEYDNVADRIKHFPALLARFFTEEMPKQKKGFLHRFLKFEREWRLVFVAIRAKQLKRDIVKELQFEDFSDALVSQILAQKDAEDYEPPEEYRPLKEMILACGPDPWQQYYTLAAYRFRHIEQMVDKPLFSIDWILAYMAQLMIVEYLRELSDTKGKMILDTFKLY